MTKFNVYWAVIDYKGYPHSLFNCDGDALDLAEALTKETGNLYAAIKLEVSK